MKARSLMSSVGLFVACLALAVFLLFPFYYAVITSFKTGTDIFRPDLWPNSFDVSNYVTLWRQQSFGRNVLNSVFVAAAVVALSLIVAVGAAFALGRVEFRGRSLLLFCVLGVSMFPQVAVLSGLFTVISALGLYDDLWALIVAYLIFTLPFTVWVLTTFMRGLPVEIEEAAILDGATPWDLVTKVFLPLLGPAMVTTGLLAFIAAWNEFLFALTFTLSNEQRTVPVAIALITGSSEYELPWGNIMAASVIVTIPLVVLVLVFQKRLVAGLTSGAVKG